MGRGEVLLGFGFDIDIVDFGRGGIMRRCIVVLTFFVCFFGGVMSN